MTKQSRRTFLTAIGAVAAVEGAKAIFTSAGLESPFGRAKVHAVPIGSYGTGQVPRQLADKYPHTANAKTDFGLQLYDDAQDSGGVVRDNQESLQRAIDSVQKLGGAIFIPPDGRSSAYMTGPLTLRDSPGYRDRSVGFCGISPGDRSRGLRNSFVAEGERYTFGCSLKLKDFSTADLLTSPANAGHLLLENISLVCDRTRQMTRRRGVLLVDRFGQYGYSAIFRNVNISGFSGAGVWNGANRNMGLYEDTWIQYCGEHSGDPAFFMGGFDSQIVRPGFGLNRGVGLYVGSTAQLEVSGGALWLNNLNMQIGADAMSVNVTRVHFDGALTENVLVSKYRGSGASAIVLNQCMFSRRGNGYRDNTYDDIRSDSQSLGLIVPQFMGNIDGKGDRSRFNINLSDDARVMLVGELYDNRSYTTAFTNRQDGIHRLGALNE